MLVLPTRQLLPSQQPVVQPVVVSQVHTPTLQSWPTWQVPHIAPPVPHCPSPWLAYGMHCPDRLQHPFGHEVASQTQLPVTQRRPAPHAAEHITPPTPQWVSSLVTQVLLWQQPLAHRVGPHWHWPLVKLQVRPIAAEQPPQAAPLVPHMPLVWLA